MRLPGVFDRAWLAAVLALTGVGLSVLLRDITATLTVPGVAGAALVALATTIPLLAAAILIPLFTASVGFARAVGLVRPRLADLGIGICAGVVVRAITEMVAPTTDTLRNPLAGGIAPAIVLSLLVAVAVSPFVEEVLFRGVLQRALADGMRASGAAIASGVAIAMATAVFVLAHITTGQVQVGLLISTIAVGVVCGLLAARTGRLTASITAHTVHNVIGVILLILASW